MYSFLLLFCGSGISRCSCVLTGTKMYFFFLWCCFPLINTLKAWCCHHRAWLWLLFFWTPMFLLSLTKPKSSSSTYYHMYEYFIFTMFDFFFPSHWSNSTWLKYKCGFGLNNNQKLQLQCSGELFSDCQRDDDCMFLPGSSCCHRLWCCWWWQVSVARAFGLWQKLLENFAHTPSLSPIDSATSHYCQSEWHRLLGSSCVAGDCRGSGVQREARSVQHQHGGGCHQGPLSSSCLGRMPQVQLRPFALQHKVHMAEKQRWMKPLNKRSSRSWKPSFAELSAGKRCCSLKCECLVRKMTKITTTGLMEQQWSIVLQVKEGSWSLRCPLLAPDPFWTMVFGAVQAFW